jgi:hypothetical protein
MLIVGHHQPGHVLQPTPAQAPAQKQPQPHQPKLEQQAPSALATLDSLSLNSTSKSKAELYSERLEKFSQGHTPWKSIGAGAGAGVLTGAGLGTALKLFAHRGITSIPGSAAASGASLAPAALMGSMIGIVAQDQKEGLKYGAAIGALYGFTIAGTLGNAMGAGSVAKGLLTVGVWMGVGALSGAAGAATAGRVVQSEY